MSNGCRDRLSPREKRKLRVREDILEAALDLFAEKGFYAVTMQEVAERAEVAVGTLYNFFESKEDLYRRLVVEHGRKVFACLRKQLASGPDDVLELLHQHIATGWRQLSSDQRILKLFLTETQGARFSVKVRLDPDLASDFESLTDELAQVMERGIREGVLRPVGGRNLALMLQGLLHSFFVEWLKNPEAEQADRNVDLIMDLFCHGALVQRGAGDGQA
ncbi:MAG: hypothetical protein Kow00109_24420 [Acidobacteriota bacterium]